MRAPWPLFTAVWTGMAVVALGLVLAGIYLYRPVRRRPWLLFAVMIGAQVPTSALLLAVRDGRLGGDPANLALAVLLGVSMVAGLAGGVLLIPGGWSHPHRRPLVVMAFAITVAIVTSAWGVARAMVHGSPSTAAAVNGPLLAAAAFVALGAGLVHALRSARRGFVSEAILVPFPGLIAVANVPAAWGEGGDSSMHLSAVGTIAAFGLVAAGALHPSMIEVARGTVISLAETPLGLMAWVVGANAVVAPLVLGAQDHPWLVPLYGAAGATGAVAVAFWRGRIFQRDTGGEGRVLSLWNAPNPDAPSFVDGHLGDDLREALATSSLALHYQPIVRLGDGLIVGAEALLRWQHPTLGNIPPDVFLPLAEAGGFFDDLGDWVIGRGVSEGGRLLAALPTEERYVSINVAPSQLEHPGFVSGLLSHLRAAGMSGKGFVLELTEQDRFRDLDQVRRVIGQLQQLGVRVAMDDFGAGHSSLGMLNALELDIVKIDRDVVRAMSNPRGRRVLRTAVELLDHLGVVVVAEGIEDLATAVALTGFGVAHGQGFGLGKPQPLDQLLSVLAESPVVDLGTGVVRPLRTAEQRR